MEKSICISVCFVRLLLKHISWRAGGNWIASLAIPLQPVIGLEFGSSLVKRECMPKICHRRVTRLCKRQDTFVVELLFKNTRHHSPWYYTNTSYCIPTSKKIYAYINRECPLKAGAVYSKQGSALFFPTPTSSPIHYSRRPYTIYRRMEFVLGCSRGEVQLCKAYLPEHERYKLLSRNQKCRSCLLHSLRMCG